MKTTYEVDQPKKIETTTFENVQITTVPPVYCPREDSFLLANAVQQLAIGNVLDMGTGSGLQAIVAAKKSEVIRVVAVDLNTTALEVAKKNAERNKVADKIEFIRSNLFEKVTGKFDVIIFNPPYLPVEKEEKRDDESMAWHGGAKGRDFLDPFLEGFTKFLKPNGKLLLLQSSLNGPVKTKRKLAELGFKVTICGEETFFFEKIFVYVAKLQ